MKNKIYEVRENGTVEIYEEVIEKKIKKMRENEIGYFARFFFFVPSSDVLLPNAEELNGFSLEEVKIDDFYADLVFENRIKIVFLLPTGKMIIRKFPIFSIENLSKEEYEKYQRIYLFLKEKREEEKKIQAIIEENENLKKILTQKEEEINELKEKIKAKNKKIKILKQKTA